MTTPTYDHLTPEQEERLDDVLFEVMHENLLNDAKYLKSIVEGYIESMETATKLTALSSDKEMQCTLLGFDPETGKPVVSDA